MRRRSIAGLTGSPIDCRHVRSPLPVVRGSSRARGKRAARRGAAHRTRAARLDRLHRAALRPPPERIRAGVARSGSPGSPASPARPAPRSCSWSGPCCSSTAATPCRRASRSIPRCSPSSISSRRRRIAGSRPISRSADRLGYDPWLHTVESAERLAKACAAAGATLVAVEPDLIDAIWSDRPAPPLGAVTLHDLRFAGEAAEDKLARIRAELAKLRADALVVSDPHAVAWAFNIRGADVAHTPLPLAFAIVPQRGPAGALCRRTQALERRARPPRNPRRRARARRFRASAGGARASTQDRAARPGHRRRCARAPRHQPRRQGRTRALPDRADEGGEEPGRDFRRARGAYPRRRRGDALSRLVRSRGSRAAHSPRSTRSRRSKAFAATPACSRTFRFRPSPAPVPMARSCITASPRKTNRAIAPGELFLIDSGGQYQDGTTDITRTVAVGEPTAEMRERFTRVLKGHIAIARAIFPDGTTGAQLDSFARQYLWAAGPRLRSRHRPWRRQLSLGARRPRAHLQAGHDARSSAA